MPKPKNPRVQLVKQMRLVKGLLESHIGPWADGGSRTVHDFALNAAGEPRKPGENVLVRPRRDDERPENDPASWRSLADTLDSIATWASKTATNARRNAETLEARQRREAREAHIRAGIDPATGGYTLDDAGRDAAYAEAARRIGGR